MNPLARIAYNMIAEGGEAAARSSGDDVLKAAAKIADEGVKVADDWGWKGGKPGEVTGKMWDAGARTDDKMRAVAREQLEKNAAKNPSSNIANNWKTLNQILGGPFDEPTANIMGDFDLLESAGIPRKWTGKVLNSLYSYGKQRVDSPGLNLRRIGDTRIPDTLALFGPGGRSGIVSVAGKVSDAMRPMTNDQRETFLSLLPEWSGSLDELADAARSL